MSFKKDKISRFPQAKKELGQHFLNDQSIIVKICDNFKNEAEAIIEIGPGPGVLTAKLAAHSLPFFVVEKDHSFSDRLLEIISDRQIFFADALELDLDKLIQKNFNENNKIWLVSNLPYNVSVPLLIKFTKIKSIKFLTLMFQKEVAEKIVPTHFALKNSAGSLNILTENFFEKKILCKVAPGSFIPPPQVESAVISFTRKESPLIAYDEFNMFENFLRKLFAFKRKQLFSVLRSFYPLEKVEMALVQNSIDKKVRAETLTFSQVTDLFLSIRNMINLKESDKREK
ncbi:MAG: ribosomal RNA small subunit methyltransferase A [Bdellovibrionales bacterium RIFOXYD12_FULL_39_22]|nr:MAG: ribosomal RNA small subunit methyltransferase A [Bdellovibrionales bacterium RIFOXYB1_FULL_39_21]OFZ44682.1 MAG: ribosomal RNA small subunit methyltransferase A [Bdellovibrionales bacterium RIFOXYC12_FULL_39_17]OFZ49312.1 MAG: ribosomal RNA small subunit methyltransferase A [Bdellovibrionales bacterium RIFOXYC1_FULL_39_130]OFZ77048.1 MAG: ribosomal RNA small subunit methyltransferase A [Bdellovibrionales bacterium RIFOXYD1_FULL_39_84]OFZ95308.1 MAG: ribosomal RNA small subunit methyltra